VIRCKTLNGTLKFEIESKGDSETDANNVQVTKLMSLSVADASRRLYLWRCWPRRPAQFSPCKRHFNN